MTCIYGGTICPLEDVEPGWYYCPQHGILKHTAWRAKCDTPNYRAAWEEGHGPGQHLETKASRPDRHTVIAKRVRFYRQRFHAENHPCRTLEEIDATLDKCFSPCRQLDHEHCLMWGNRDRPCRRDEAWIRHIVYNECELFESVSQGD